MTHRRPGQGENGVVTTVDYHTGGEPFRVVTGGAPEIPGATVLDRREHARPIGRAHV